MSGLTTASVIWVAAAIGMAVGAGDFETALTTTVVTLLILLLFSLLERSIDKVHHDKLYVVVFSDAEFNNLILFEKSIEDHHLKFIRRQISKHDGCLQAALLVTGHRKKISKLDEELLVMPNVKSF